jgi:hypothetical protein
MYAPAQHVIVAGSMSRGKMALQFGTFIACVKSKQHPGASARNSSPGERHAMSPRRNEELIPDGRIAPQDTDSDELARLKAAQHCDRHPER